MFFPGIFEAKQHGTYKLVSRDILDHLVKTIIADYNHLLKSWRQSPRNFWEHMKVTLE